MTRSFSAAMVSVCLGLLLFAGMPAGAQTVQTLTINDGTILINGQEVSEQDLPDIDLRGVTATYTFIGDARPLIEIGGALYLVDGQRLRAVAELRQEQGAFNLFYDGDADDTPLLGRYKVEDKGASLARAQAEALQQSTEELGRLSSQVDQRQANQALKEAQVRVAQAAQVVEAYPTLQVQSYLSDVQQYNQSLYAMLVREWRMEREAEALAREIRTLTDAALRTERIATLRQTLQEIFELKQQNRRLEIQQLEHELDALNERLQKREARREELVELRINQLVGIQYPPDNR